MQASSWKVEDLVPHRPPMLLIDAIEEVDMEAPRLAASFLGREEWRGNWFALEYMAQAAAALSGAMDRAERPSASPRPGLLLGTKRLDLGIAEFVPGRRYVVEAVRECEDGEAAVFSCTVRAAGRDQEPGECSAAITAFRPREA